MEMSNDSGAVVNAAVDAAMSLHSRTMRPSELSSEKLAALCRIKGLRQRPSTSASEQRRVLVDAVTKYLDDEYSARTKLGKWDSLSEAARIRLLHRVCNAEGDVTYYDPATGYTVFSAFAHLRRGHCCGIEDGTGARMHRCRHCPYAEDGTLPSKQMVAMKERISLVDAFREELTARTHTDHAVSTPSSKPAQSDSAVAHDPVAASVGSVETDVDVCPTCHGTEMMVCTRCNGWTILASPIIRKCQQCNASGWHGCMDCTPWRPRQRTEFYS